MLQHTDSGKYDLAAVCLLAAGTVVELFDSTSFFHLHRKKFLKKGEGFFFILSVKMMDDKSNVTFNVPKFHPYTLFSQK